MPTRVVSSAVDQADECADDEAGDDAGRGAVVVHRDRGDQRDEARHHADREVDLASRENIGHADRHDRDHRGLAEDVEQIVRLEEALVVQRRREEREDQHEAEIGDVLAPVREERRRAGLGNGVRHGRAPSG